MLQAPSPKRLALPRDHAFTYESTNEKSSHRQLDVTASAVRFRDALRIQWICGRIGRWEMVKAIALFRISFESSSMVALVESTDVPRVKRRR
jgi:hypothetical protein